jgi:hypothetical protein
MTAAKIVSVGSTASVLLLRELGTKGSPGYAAFLALTRPRQSASRSARDVGVWQKFEIEIRPRP